MGPNQGRAASLAPKRILAIDYGTRRVGIAISDPMKLIAQGLPTLKNDENLFDNLRAIAKENDIERIIVAKPNTLKGEVGDKRKEVQEFIHRLENEVEIPDITWDERFTTRLAQSAIREMGTKKMQRRRKGRVDEMASRLLLQSYLDSRKG